MDARRSNVDRRLASVDAEGSLGWAAREAGDGSWLASRARAAEVGCLPGSTTSRATAALRRGPRPDPATGVRESGMGLFPNPRRTLQAWAPGGRDHDPIGVLIKGKVPPAGRRAGLSWK